MRDSYCKPMASPCLLGQKCQINLWWRPAMQGTTTPPKAVKNAPLTREDDYILRPPIDKLHKWQSVFSTFVKAI